MQSCAIGIIINQKSNPDDHHYNLVRPRCFYKAAKKPLQLMTKYANE